MQLNLSQHYIQLFDWLSYPGLIFCSYCLKGMIHTTITADKSENPKKHVKCNAITWPFKYLGAICTEFPATTTRTIFDAMVCS